MGRYELSVGGMQCIGCERIVEHELERIDGVNRVDADHRAGVVECALRGATESEVARAIETLGYEVTG